MNNFRIGDLVEVPAKESGEIISFVGHLLHISTSTGSCFLYKEQCRLLKRHPKIGDRVRNTRAIQVAKVEGTPREKEYRGIVTRIYTLSNNDKFLEYICDDTKRDMGGDQYDRFEVIEMVEEIEEKKMPSTYYEETVQLKKTLGEQEVTINKLVDSIRSMNNQQQADYMTIADKDEQISSLKKALTERDITIMSQLNELLLCREDKSTPRIIHNGLPYKIDGPQVINLLNSLKRMRENYLSQYNLTNQARQEASLNKNSLVKLCNEITESINKHLKTF